MSRLAIVTLGATVLSCALVARAAAQDPSLDSNTVAAHRAALRSDLRNFVVAQEAYFADHGTYASSLRALGAGYGASRGVTLVVLTASNRGHSAIVLHERVTGLVCAVHVGNAQPPLEEGEEGDPVCRGP